MNCQRCSKETEKAFKSLKNELYLCWDCKNDELQLALQSVNGLNSASASLLREESDMHGVKTTGDIFNLEAQTLSELKRLIYSDETLSEQERIQKYHEAIAARIMKFNELIRQKDDEKFEIVQQKTAAMNELRSYGNQVRDEIREKIKENDANYQPAKIEIKPKIKAKKNDPFEQMAQIIALSNGISIEAARLRLKEGGFKNEVKK